MPVPRLLLALLATSALYAQDVRLTLNGFDDPASIGFSFLAWKDKATVSDGHLVLSGVASTGGLGSSKKLDLTPYGEAMPVLLARTRAGNTAREIKLKLTDADGHTGTWIFTLPAPAPEFTSLTPTGCTALTLPNALENKNDATNLAAPDLARITSQSLMGDWSRNELDVEVDAIVLVDPTAAQLAERTAYRTKRAAEVEAETKRKADAVVATAKDREDRVKRYSKITERSPSVAQVSLVAPDILELQIDAQAVEPATLTKYEALPGDEVKDQKWPDGTVRQAYLYRGGKRVGRLQGQHLAWFSTFEKVSGDPLLEFLAEDPVNYRIASSDDAAFATPVAPAAVYRKSAPNDAVLPGGACPTTHRLYLKLAAGMRISDGKTYTIAISALNVRTPTLTFAADLKHTRTESLHVNQLGFRPDDTSKLAFLSIWLGSGGACALPTGLAFQVLDDVTGAVAFSGTTQQVLAVDGTESLWIKPAKNYTQTAVQRLDFSALTKPGTYRLAVDGIGCSYPFTIGDSVWEHAFLVQMKGLYNQRSGIELGPPYSDFKKPRDFHPDDGAIATRTTFDFAKGSPTAYAEIAKGDTGEVVKNAWGGYHDAGDWNPRRVSHMYVTLAQLELMELYPSYFASLKLNIPPSDHPGLPDIISEALFEIDCFRRLQRADGAMPWGIETNGDPLSGEISWLSTQHCYVAPPTIRESWFYAAVAGRAAKVLRAYDAALSKTYEQSAIAAFTWAEQTYAKDRSAKDSAAAAWDAIDNRNLSSVILYDLTGEQSYHAVFVEDTGLKDPKADLYSWGHRIQSHAVFQYARLEHADPALKAAAIAGITRLADLSLDYANGNAFHLTNRERARPMFAGFFGSPGGTELARAHYLTGKPEYLAGTLRSCLYPAGANPGNRVYTTGLGANPVRHPLQVDARSSGQAPPIGLTVWGNVDIWNWNGFWQTNLAGINKPEYLWPDVFSWPLTEAYFDTYLFVPANEFVVDSWAPNVFVWGYLAARPKG